MASDWKVMLVRCCHSGALVRVTLTLRCGHFPLQQPLILHVDVFTASCVLCQCCWDPERSQPHHCLYGWQNVFLEPGHALHPTGASLLSCTLQPAASKTSLHRNMSPKVPKACFSQSALEAKTYFLCHKLCHYCTTLILRSVSNENERIHLKAQRLEQWPVVWLVFTLQLWEAMKIRVELSRATPSRDSPWRKRIPAKQKPKLPLVSVP